MTETQSDRIDLGVDAIEVLCQLPGVGPALAQRIIEARPFADLDDVQRVKGIGPVTLERLRPLVTLSAAGEGPDAQWEQAGAEEGTVDDREQQALTQPISAQAQDPDAEGADQVASEMAAEAGKADGPPTPETAGEESGAGEPLPPEDEADVPDLAWELEDVDEEAVPGPAEQEPPPEPPPPLVSRAGVSRRYVLSMAGLVGAIALVLGVLLSLGVVASLNGGQLQFITPDEFSALDVRVEGLETRSEGLVEDVATLRERLNNLDALGGRMDAAEQNLETVQSDLEATAAGLEGLIEDTAALQSDLTALDSDVDGLSTTVGTLQQERERFQAFLDGLRALMDSLDAGAAEGGE